MMTNDQAVAHCLGDSERQCLWQLVPSQLPKDLPRMALECWQTADGALHLIQLHVADPRGGHPEVGRVPWFERVHAVTHFRGPDAGRNGAY